MALTKIDDRGLTTPIDLLDSEKIRFGTGNDLEIYHDGSNSRIMDTGTGALAICGSIIGLNNAASTETMLLATENGAVKLYNDGSPKFETTSIGSTITGSLTINNSNYDGLIVKNNDDGSNGAYITLINDSASPSNADYAGIVNFRGKDSAGNDTTYGQIRAHTTDVTDGQESGEISFNVRNSNTFEEMVRIKSNGRVGIGTTSPANPLEVKSAGTSTAVFGNRVAHFRSDASGRDAHIGFGDNVNASAAIGYSNPELYFYVAGAERLRLKSDGDVEIKDGDLVIGTSGHGIDFSATGDATGKTSELLDDYEEGQWDLTGAKCNVDLHDSYDNGWYVKVGHMVTCGAYVQSDETSTDSTTTLTFTLPFATSAAPSGGDTGWIGGCSTNSFALSANMTQTNIAAGDASATASIRQSGGASSWLNLRLNQFADGKLMQFTLTYKCQ